MSNDRVAVFSHGGFHNLLLSALLNLHDDRVQPTPETVRAQDDQNLIPGAASNFWFGLSNCAMTRIDFDPEEVRIVYQNRVEFLPRELIT
jgi:broad specificity phosphatase PhoE